MNKIFLLFIMLVQLMNAQSFDVRIYGTAGKKFASTDIYVKHFDYGLDDYTKPQILGKTDVNGSFDFVLTLQEHELIGLSFGGEKFTTLAIEEGEYLKFTSENERFSYSGSKASEEIRGFKKSLNPLNEKYFGALTKKTTMAMETNDTVLIRELEQNQKDILPLFNKELEGNVSKIQSPAARFYAITFLDENKNKDFLIEICHHMIEKNKNSPMAKNLTKKLNRIQSLAVGMYTPPIDANDIEGHRINIQDYRGKYLFIDFWASWCIPCRIENPKILHIYQTLPKNDFDIIAISLDDDLSKMQNAIKKDGCTWPQIQDLNKVISSSYGVSSLPQNILLDREGRILHKNLRSEDLIKILLELGITP